MHAYIYAYTRPLEFRAFVSKRCQQKKPPQTPNLETAKSLSPSYIDQSPSQGSFSSPGINLHCSSCPKFVTPNLRARILARQKWARTRMQSSKVRRGLPANWSSHLFPFDKSTQLTLEIVEGFKRLYRAYLGIQGLYRVITAAKYKYMFYRD